MKLQIDLNAKLEVEFGAPALFLVEVPTISGIQQVSKSLIEVSPYVALEPYHDLHGNLCRRAVISAGPVQLHYAAHVDVSPLDYAQETPREVDVMRLSADVLDYLLPSRYCESDRLDGFARAEFGNLPHSIECVQAICTWINTRIEYLYGVSTSITSACDTLLQRSGVCRDFAHLGISFCRALNIPARYVSGYCLGLFPPDFHAYFQAYLNDRWVTFDPTTATPREALVSVAVGRDAADCAWCSLFSPGTTTELTVTVSRLAESIPA